MENARNRIFQGLLALQKSATLEQEKAASSENQGAGTEDNQQLERPEVAEAQIDLNPNGEPAQNNTGTVTEMLRNARERTLRQKLADLEQTYEDLVNYDTIEINALILRTLQEQQRLKELKETLPQVPMSSQSNPVKRRTLRYIH